MESINENLYVYAGVISTCYIIFSILEMRFLNDDAKPLKEVFKNTLVVFFSSLCGIYVLTSFNSSAQTLNKVIKPTEVFTGNPEF
tara:strand:- start:404 stop:658 length:255 start_codon:yes stop_codon:yes gene_type:complete